MPGDELAQGSSSRIVDHRSHDGLIHPGRSRDRVRRLDARPNCRSRAHSLLIMSGWETEVDELRLTLPLIAAGLGFGLVIPPIGISALSAAPSHYWGAAASLGHRIANGGDGVGAGGPVSLGHRALLQPDRRRVPGSGSYQDTEAFLIDAGVTVFQNLFHDHGVSVPDCHPAGPADEGGTCRRDARP